MSKECIWRSPNGVAVSNIAEVSEGFEKKYGVNIFSDEIDPSRYIPIKPSDLEFSPQLQCLFKEPSGNVSSPSNNGNSAVPSSSASSSSPRNAPASSSGTPSVKKSESYLEYGGSTFGLKPSLPTVRHPNHATGPLNPWILSDGIPNFAKNQKYYVLKELRDNVTQRKRTVDDSDAIVDSVVKKARTSVSEEDQIDEEDLLKAIRDELKEYDRIDKKIVDAVSAVADPST